MIAVIAALKALFFVAEVEANDAIAAARRDTIGSAAVFIDVVGIITGFKPVHAFAQIATNNSITATCQMTTV